MSAGRERGNCCHWKWAEASFCPRSASVSHLLGDLAMKRRQQAEPRKQGQQGTAAG